MNTTEILEICSKIKGNKALATNKGSKELLENFYDTVCDQDSCSHEGGHDVMLSCCGERAVEGHEGCETIIVEVSKSKDVRQVGPLKSRGWFFINLDPVLVFTKNGEIVNAIKNPKKSEIRVEKPVQDAIIDVEKEPVAKPVGTTPDPEVLFPEKDEKEKPVEKKEKPSYKPMKKKW